MVQPLCSMQQDYTGMRQRGDWMTDMELVSEQMLLIAGMLSKLLHTTLPTHHSTAERRCHANVDESPRLPPA